MVFKLWADVQLYLMKWWHWQHWWRCNAIQELQALSDIAFSANFESDNDEEGGDEEADMLMTMKCFCQILELLRARVLK